MAQRTTTVPCVRSHETSSCNEACVCDDTAHSRTHPVSSINTEEIAHYSGNVVDAVEVCGRGKDICTLNLTSVFAAPRDAQLLSHITSFDLSHNSIKNVNELYALTSLQRLNISYNGIRTVATGLPSTLVELTISHNKLTSLNGLAELAGLSLLDVAHNRLTDFTGLCGKNGTGCAKSLCVLHADNNRITRMAGLNSGRSSWPSLREVSLCHNCLNSTDELLCLSNMPSLRVLRIAHNGVSNSSGFRDFIAILQPRIISLDGSPLVSADRKCHPRAMSAHAMPNTACLGKETSDTNLLRRGASDSIVAGRCSSECGERTNKADEEDRIAASASRHSTPHAEPKPPQPTALLPQRTNTLVQNSKRRSRNLNRRSSTLVDRHALGPPMQTTAYANSDESSRAAKKSVMPASLSSSPLLVSAGVSYASRCKREASRVAREQEKISRAIFSSSAAAVPVPAPLRKAQQRQHQGSCKTDEGGTDSTIALTEASLAGAVNGTSSRNKPRQSSDEEETNALCREATSRHDAAHETAHCSSRVDRYARGDGAGAGVVACENEVLESTHRNDALRGVVPNRCFAGDDSYGNDESADLHSSAALLYDALSAKEQLERENRTLRTHVATHEAQLSQARRVISNQLQELSRTRLERDALRRDNRELMEKVERTRAQANAAAQQLRVRVGELHEKYERMAAMYNVQLMDAKRQSAGVSVGNINDHRAISFCPAAGLTPAAKQVISHSALSKAETKERCHVRSSRVALMSSRKQAREVKHVEHGSLHQNCDVDSSISNSNSDTSRRPACRASDACTLNESKGKPTPPLTALELSSIHGSASSARSVCEDTHSRHATLRASSLHTNSECIVASERLTACQMSMLHAEEENADPSQSRMSSSSSFVPPSSVAVVPAALADNTLAQLRLWGSTTEKVEVWNATQLDSDTIKQQVRRQSRICEDDCDIHGSHVDQKSEVCGDGTRRGSCLDNAISSAASGLLSHARIEHTVGCATATKTRDSPDGHVLGDAQSHTSHENYGIPNTTACLPEESSTIPISPFFEADSDDDSCINGAV